jgi:hypothetical protein
MMSVPLHAEPLRGPGLPRLAVNVLGFQLGWFACVLGAARGLALAGTLVAAAVVAAHFALSRRPGVEAQLALAAMVLGLVWDGLCVQLGWIAYAAPGPWPALAPAWIIAMWALFATTLNVSLRTLQTRPGLAAALGALAGPLAYWGAQRLGACQLVAPVAATLALAIGWALFTPLLLALARVLTERAEDARHGGRRG